MKLLKRGPESYRMVTTVAPFAYLDFEVRKDAQKDRRVFANILKMERRALTVWKEVNRA